MILICLFTKKRSFNLFSINDLIQFHLCLLLKKRLFVLIVSKNNYYKILIWQQKLFYLLFLENNEFLQFYLQKYFDSFLFKKKK